ncbi:hypothetical protein SMU26_06806, partial [Streptococcus mutans 3SN1]
ELPKTILTINVSSFSHDNPFYCNTLGEPFQNRVKKT